MKKIYYRSFSLRTCSNLLWCFDMAALNKFFSDNRAVGWTIVIISLFIPSISIGYSVETEKLILVTPILIVRRYSPNISLYGGVSWDFSLFPFTLVPTIFILSSAFLGYYLVRETNIKFKAYNALGIIVSSLLHLIYFPAIMKVSQPRYSFKILAIPAFLDIIIAGAYFYMLYPEFNNAGQNISNEKEID